MLIPFPSSCVPSLPRLPIICYDIRTLGDKFMPWVVMEATRLSGVNVDARIVLCYIISVVCAVLVGVIRRAFEPGPPATGEVI
ncbi:MAG: hypothetical protein R2932_45950 [Caldilineaceae bacterium]